MTNKMNTEVMNESANTLREAVATMRGGRMASIVIVSEVGNSTMRKTDNPYFGRVKKVLTMDSIRVASDYRHIVGKEESEPLVWGKWAMFPRIVEHKGNEYMRFYTSKNTKAKAVYVMDGRIMTSAEVEDMKRFFYKKDNERSVCLTVKFANIAMICYDKKVFANANLCKEVADANVEEVRVSR